MVQTVVSLRQLEPGSNTTRQTRKRKVSTDMNDSRKKPKHTSTRKALRPFRLLDLPAELRNAVYEKVLGIYSVAHLSRYTTDRNLLTDCRLVSVSKQVRKEFMDAMNLYVPTIRTAVLDFNFGHVIHWLNRMPDVELQKLESDTQSGARVMRIELHFWNSSYDMSGLLMRWLNRIDESTKRGVNVEYQYVYEGPEWPDDVYALHYSGKGRREVQKISNAAGGGKFWCR